MHLANGEVYSLNCACCSSGYDGPFGYVVRTIHEFTPTPFIARRVRMDGDEFMYSESPRSAPCYSSVQATHLYLTEEECAAACAKLTAQYQEDMEKSLLRQLASKRESLAFSVHYWRNQVNKIEKDLERAKAQLNRCKQSK